MSESEQKLPYGMKVAPTIEVKIYIGGDYEEACRIANKYCTQKGLCVTVTPTEYVYKHGRESGVIIGLMNYPRFPSTEQELFDHAMRLASGITGFGTGAENLIQGLCQGSFSIVTRDETYWYSIRSQDH